MADFHTVGSKMIMRNDNWLKGASLSLNVSSIPQRVWRVCWCSQSQNISLSEVKVPVSQEKELLREHTQNTEWESNVISCDCWLTRCLRFQIIWIKTPEILCYRVMFMAPVSYSVNPIWIWLERMAVLIDCNGFSQSFGCLLV